MPISRSASLRKLSIGMVAACAIAATPASAALLVYEPFDYPAGSILDGTSATGLNLAGTYVSDMNAPAYQLQVSQPGSSYGNLSGAPTVSGSKLTQLQGAARDRSTVALAQPITIAPGEAIFFSALFTLDDSSNANRLAAIDLIDDDSGDSIHFGESIVGVRAIRASFSSGAGGTLTTRGDDRAFSDGQTVLLIGRYNNSPVPLGDRLELLGYDTAASHPLPASFDPGDPNTIFYQELAGVSIDFTRISSLRFIIRGDDNNYIDELRIGSTLADVAPIPEPHTWLLTLCGIAAVAARVRFRANRRFNSSGCSLP